MNVHLAASRYNLKDNIKRLRLIVDAVHQYQSKIVHDWLEPGYIQETKEGHSSKNTDWVQVHRDSIEAIAKSDVVIVDTTARSFNVGYQVALALQMKKPTLVLAPKNGADEAVFARGIETGVTFVECPDDQVGDIVEGFLQENDIQTKDMRFNFFIDRQIYNYLRWTSAKKGKTKAEILRELVLREINKEDDI